MDKRLKVVILGGFLVCVMAIAFLILQNPEPQSLPDFLVSDVNGEVGIGPGDRPSDFKLSFHIENNGTRIAKNVGGTVSFEKGGRWTAFDWHFHNDFEKVLEVGERSLCVSYFWFVTTVPSKNFVIFVFCDEGVTRQFNVTIT